MTCRRPCSAGSKGSGGGTSTPTWAPVGTGRCCSMEQRETTMQVTVHRKPVKERKRVSGKLSYDESNWVRVAKPTETRTVHVLNRKANRLFLLFGQAGEREFDINQGRGYNTMRDWVID